MGSDSRACRAFFLGALLLVSGLARPAFAAPSAAEREAAHRLMDDGVAKMKANEPQKALDSFQKANELMHVPTTGIWVAKAQLAAGHLVEAREAAVDVARTTKEPNEPAVFEKARRQARDIEAQVKGRIPTVKIHIRGGTPSAVAVDGTEVPIALLSEPVPVNPGKRMITAKASDGSEGKTEIDIREGEKSDTELTLLPPKSSTEPSKPPPPSPASSSSSAASSAAHPPPSTSGDKPKILGFGNEDVGSRGTRRTPLAEGLIWGGFSVGLVGLGVGGVTGFMTLGKATDVKKNCENNVCGPEAKKDLDSANLLGTIATISVAVGIAGLGAGILGLAIPSTPPAPAARTGLVVRPTSNGIEGTF